MTFISRFLRSLTAQGAKSKQSKKETSKDSPQRAMAAQKAQTANCAAISSMQKCRLTSNDLEAGNVAVQSKLDSGADPTVLSDKPLPPLAFGILRGLSQPTLDVLLKYGAGPDTPIVSNDYQLCKDSLLALPPLLLAAWLGNTDAMHALIKHGADTDAKAQDALGPTLRTSNILDTAVRQAEGRPHQQCVSIVAGDSVLHAAIKGGSIKALRFLLAHAAVDIACTDVWGENALMLALRLYSICMHNCKAQLEHAWPPDSWLSCMQDHGRAHSTSTFRVLGARRPRQAQHLSAKSADAWNMHALCATLIADARVMQHAHLHADIYLHAALHSLRSAHAIDLFLSLTKASVNTCIGLIPGSSLLQARSSAGMLLLDGVRAVAYASSHQQQPGMITVGLEFESLNLQPEVTAVRITDKGLTGGRHTTNLLRRRPGISMQGAAGPMQALYKGLRYSHGAALFHEQWGSHAPNILTFAVAILKGLLNDVLSLSMQAWWLPASFLLGLIGGILAIMLLPALIATPASFLRTLWKAFLMCLLLAAPVLAALLLVTLAGTAITLSAWLSQPASISLDTSSSSFTLHTVSRLIRQYTFWPLVLAGAYCFAAVGWVVFWALQAFLMRQLRGRSSFSRHAARWMSFSGVLSYAWWSIPWVMGLSRQLSVLRSR